MRRVAVIGGGIFGASAALLAARAGHKVELFESLGGLLQAASGINQYRLHRGYHYPRSSETAQSALDAEHLFRKEFGEAVLDDGNHLYAIAREGSKVSGEQFLAFCDKHGLAYEVLAECEYINPEMIELVIRAHEGRYDPAILRALVEQKLTEAGVTVHLNTRAGREIDDQFDKIIIATYANNNHVFAEFTDAKEEHQYEVCEKPVVRLPERFGMTDLVVMDGPFMCVDPLGRSGVYVLGNVIHAIHATNVGLAPEVPPELAPYLNKGIIERPSITNFDAFIETGARYIPILQEAEHVGSLYTVRTVLPRLDATDARPTLVTILDDKYIKIFSGKVGNSVLAAQEAVALI